MTAAPTTETFSRFDDPKHLIATSPAEVQGSGRDDVRMLVAGGTGLSHQRFRDLPQNLRPCDLLVVNTSATLPASLRASDGLRVHISTKAPDGNWVVEVRIPDGVASRPLEEVPPPTLYLAGGGCVDLLRPYTDADPGRLWLARVQVDRVDRTGFPTRSVVNPISKCPIAVIPKRVYSATIQNIVID